MESLITFFNQTEILEAFRKVNFDLFWSRGGGQERKKREEKLILGGGGGGGGGLGW